MLGIYAHLLAIVLILSGTAALALIRGVGLGVGMFHPSSATIFASVGFSRRGSIIIRVVLFLLSGLLVAFSMSVLRFPFEGRGWE
jgi:hypothetical protein